MKYSIKNIVGLALCVGLLQSPVQASPLSEFCKKWIARGAAVGYAIA